MSRHHPPVLWLAVLFALSTLLLAAAGGFIIYQKAQFGDLMQEYVDLKWQSGNTEANLAIARNHLEACKAERADARD